MTSTGPGPAPSARPRGTAGAAPRPSAGPARIPVRRPADEAGAARRHQRGAGGGPGPLPDAGPAPRTLAELDQRLTGCRACPRLVEWRERAGRTRRRAFLDWDYWARPVPGFGPPDAPMLILGLAPAAHGGNRTGRMFTGDRSGDFLYAALYGLGLASRPDATRRDDGLELYGVRVTAPVHCAPPANKPTIEERDTCAPWLLAELALLRPTLRSVVVLGAFGWQAALPVLASAGWTVPRPRPSFGHGAVAVLADGGGRPLTLFGCYHVSQQNTFTGRLTQPMLRDVLAAAAREAGAGTAHRQTGGAPHDPQGTQSR